MKYFIVITGTVILFIGVARYACLSGAFGVPNSAEYAGDCEATVFREEGEVERVVEFLLEGETIGKNVSLVLPVVYDTPVRTLTRVNDYYVGARCLFTRKDDDDINIKGDILLTYMDETDNERHLARIKLKSRAFVDGVSEKIIGIPTELVDENQELTDEFLETVKWHYHLTVIIRKPLLAPAMEVIKTNSG